MLHSSSTCLDFNSNSFIISFSLQKQHMDYKLFQQYSKMESQMLRITDNLSIKT